MTATQQPETQIVQAPTLDHATKAKCRRIEAFKQALVGIPARIAPIAALEALFTVLRPAVREEIALLTTVEGKMRSAPENCELERVNHAAKCAQNIYESLFEMDYRVLVSEWFLAEIRQRVLDLRNLISLEGYTLLNATIRDFADHRDGGKGTTGEMAARFTTLAELITDAEDLVRDQAKLRVIAILKPAPIINSGKSRRYVGKGEKRANVGKKGERPRKRGATQQTA